jgi:hypothetical protein
LVRVDIGVLFGSVFGFGSRFGIAFGFGRRSWSLGPELLLSPKTQLRSFDLVRFLGVVSGGFY